MSFYIDRNNKRFNPYATYTVLGVVYEKGDILKFPEAIAYLGIEEVQEPDPPDEYKTNPEYYFRTEQETFPYVIYTRKSEEQIRQAFVSKLPVLTPWQMRKALRAAGLMSAVKTAMQAADEEVKEAWEFAQEFRRDNELVCSVAAALGKTEEDLDNLWILGGSL
jgi:hypothetical protein